MPFLPDVILIGQMPLAIVAVTGLVGGLAAYLLAGWLARREGAPTEGPREVVLSLLLGGVLGAKLVYVLLDLPGHLANPASLIIFPYGPLALPAGLVGGTALVALELRKHPEPRKTLDHVAAPLTLGAGLAVAGWHGPGSWAFAPLMVAAGVAALIGSLRQRMPGVRAAQTLVIACAALVAADLARPAAGLTGLQTGAVLAGTAAWLWLQKAWKKDSGT
ncbi:MAG TPA: prolipoprotein diacylglyceryl transferase family protein [Symbiobacteriaceae bacterium]|nr:prolipoprotein diacylglyceryl transferase family protein [Symbiobacteriaceae bacterium]